jgi:hypothetical protein
LVQGSLFLPILDAANVRKCAWPLHTDRLAQIIAFLKRVTGCRVAQEALAKSFSRH